MLDISGTAAPALDARVLDVFAAAVSGALDSASGLDGRRRLDAIRALERLGCVVTAASHPIAGSVTSDWRKP